MKYILFHKNIPVFSFLYENSDNLKVMEIFNKEHIPVAVYNQDKEKLNLNFKNWFKNRGIPQSRQNYNDALNLLNDISSDTLIKNSYGLSLSDHYWFKKENESIEWSKINFFDNDFSEELGQLLFGQKISPENINLLSPENTSDGWLKKKWIIDSEKKRILVKAGSGTERQEPFNEVLASEICRILDFSNVKYSLMDIDGELCSACCNFLDSSTEFVLAMRIHSLRAYNGGLWDKYNFFLENCKIAGIKNIQDVQKNLCQMIILDFIIANTDRHFGNFGFIRDSQTLEWKGAAPIFDSGTSMFIKLSENELKTKDKVDSKNILARPFGYKQSDQIKLLPVKKYFDKAKLELLIDFKIDEFYDSILRKSSNISEQRRELLCKILMERIKELRGLL